MRLPIKKIRTSTFLFGFAAILALWMGIHIQSTLAEVKEKHKVQVVMLSDQVSLAPYSVIQASDISLKEVDRSSIHSDTVFSLADVMGKRTSIALLPSTVLRSGHLLQGDSITNVLTNLGKNNLVAVTISLEPDQMDLSRAGDRVTLHGLIRQGVGTALLSIREVLVLEKKDHIMTAAVTVEQSDALNQVLLSGGKIRIVLHQP